MNPDYLPYWPGVEPFCPIFPLALFALLPYCDVGCCGGGVSESDVGFCGVAVWICGVGSGCSLLIVAAAAVDRREIDDADPMPIAIGQ